MFWIKTSQPRGCALSQTTPSSDLRSHVAKAFPVLAGEEPKCGVRSPWARHVRVTCLRGLPQHVGPTFGQKGAGQGPASTLDKSITFRPFNKSFMKEMYGIKSLWESAIL